MAARKQPDQSAAYRLFISYRRGQNTDFVEHIRSWFSWRFGRDNVFLDFDSIPAGQQFPDFIRQEIKRCDAMLLIIDPDWEKVLLERLWQDTDWVRGEVELALEENKLVVPICIKGAALPEKLPKQLRGMLNTQAAYLQPGMNFIAGIERAVAAVHDTLVKRIARQKAVEELDAISPAAGLALGYYVNFVKPLGMHLRNCPSVRLKDQTVEFPDEAARQGLALNIVIPLELCMFRNVARASLEPVLEQIAIQPEGFGRPFPVYARRIGGELRIVDFPRTVTVIENWLARRIAQESIDPKSDEALKLEQQELDRFEGVLKWWIEDQANDPAFRARVKVSRFTSENPDLQWLAVLWPAEERDRTGD